MLGLDGSGSNMPYQSNGLVHFTLLADILMRCIHELVSILAGLRAREANVSENAEASNSVLFKPWLDSFRFNQATCISSSKAWKNL